MTALGERLAAALAASYRIERELGGGGMSQVFLAHETALGRPVVIKGRFYRFGRWDNVAYWGVLHESLLAQGIPGFERVARRRARLQAIH